MGLVTFSLVARLALVIAACCLALGASAKARSQQSGSLHSLFTRLHDEGKFNGVVLVARGRKIVHEAAYGYRDAANSARLHATDRFNLGSIGKEFSAVALMQLHERGALDIDAPIAIVLADLPPWSKEVTAHHLLDYTSGLPDLRWRAIKDDRDAYADLRNVTALAFEPGTQFNYGYNNVMLRQFMVDRVAGVPFRDFVSRTIFKPCRMRHAVLDPAGGTRRVARSFNRDRKPDDTFMPISGVVFATARDLFRWRECLHSGRVIGEESIALLGHSFNPHNGALGKVVWRGDRLVEHRHLGQSRNFEALLFTDLPGDVTVVLLSNSKRDNLEEILSAVLESM